MPALRNHTNGAAAPFLILDSGMKTILVTGGAGYIGTHTCVELAAAGYEVVIVDNLSNSKRQALQRVETLIGRPIPFYQADILDADALRQIFESHCIDAVMHFAGLKAVGESVEKPLLYYGNNVTGTMCLIDVMREYKVHTLVFSSSATVYGEPDHVPIMESESIKPINPYGRSKAMVEVMLQDIAAAEPCWSIAILRYFNPVGAHESGTIGEDPNGIPNNLLPYITQVAVGQRPFLRVWGNDYDTPDGTGVRDYIHVQDLARGHLAALQRLEQGNACLAVNLGTGRGYSVLDMVHAFAAASGREIPWQLMERRPGDIASCYADPQLAWRELGWRAELGVERMCADAWRWQSANPAGYGD